MPTRIGYHVPASGNYSAVSVSKATPAAVNAAVNDGIVIISSSEQAGTNANVTPSLSNGSVAWDTPTVVNPSGGASVSGAWMWKGKVTSALSNAIITLNSPNTGGSSFWWGFSGTVWAGPLDWGNIISGTNGTGSGSPQVSIAVEAGSAAQVGVNDWNAASGAGRTWIDYSSSLNETFYLTDISHHTVYGAYWLNVGSAGTKPFGLTAPTNMRWSMVGVEIRDQVASAPAPVLTESGLWLSSESGVPILL